MLGRANDLHSGTKMPQSGEGHVIRKAAPILKRVFGSWWSRLIRGGTKLSRLEFEFLLLLIDALPEVMKDVVRTQFEAFNLVQREVDGRALNFYRMKGGKPDMKGLPLLKTAQTEAPLVKITADVACESEPVHAVLTAVNGQAFSVTFSRRIANISSGKVLEVTRVKQAWRSVVSGIVSAV